LKHYGFCYFLVVLFSYKVKNNDEKKNTFRKFKKILIDFHF